MADPRLTTAFSGIDQEFATYQVDASIVYDATQVGGSAVVGRAVAVTGARQVGLATDGQLIEGKLILVEPDNRATVQIEGFTTLPAGTGATFTGVGQRAVGALLGTAAGYIRAAASADALNADAEIIDASDTTAVIVDL